MHMFGLKKSVGTNTPPQSLEGKDPFEQLPIDTYVDAVALNWSGTPIIKIVVMSGQTATGYASYTEYHHCDTATSINDVGSFNLCTSALNPGTTTAITSFVGSMPQQFSIQQAPSWHRGVFSPTAARARLYKATDPDDNTKQIGLLLEQNTSGQLVRCTWYKTQDATAIFRDPQSSLSFHGVLDSNNSPSTDPNDIGGWTWYYTN